MVWVFEAGLLAVLTPIHVCDSMYIALLAFTCQDLTLNGKTYTYEPEYRDEE